MASRHKTSNQNRKSKTSDTYLKYSGLAFQMAVTIGLMAFLGYKIDIWLNLNFPVFLLIFVFAGLAGSIYQLIRSLQDN